MKPSFFVETKLMAEHPVSQQKIEPKTSNQGHSCT
jgi:hypothetical protein